MLNIMDTTASMPNDQGEDITQYVSRRDFDKMSVGLADCCVCRELNRIDWNRREAEVEAGAVTRPLLGRKRTFS